MHTLQWLIDNGCELQKPNIEILEGIYEISGGEPCKECNCKRTCPAWAEMELETSAAKILVRTNAQEGIRAIGSPETNREIATRLGITKRQVSKMKVAGTLPK